MACASNGGGGASSLPGDVTWIHRSYDATPWVRPGGHFVRASSSAALVEAGGTYRFELDRGRLADLRVWLADPRRNFGWMLIGDESEGQTAKNFASREHPDPSMRPALEITYRPAD